MKTIKKKLIFETKNINVNTEKSYSTHSSNFFFFYGKWWFIMRYNGTIERHALKIRKKSSKVKSSTNNVLNPLLSRYLHFLCTTTCIRIIYSKDFILIWWYFAWISRISSMSTLKSDYMYMLYWCTHTYSVCKTSFHLETLDTARIITIIIAFCVYTIYTYNAIYIYMYRPTYYTYKRVRNI